jgi:hypothetical protein
MQFVEIDFYNLIFQNSSTDQQGVSRLVSCLKWMELGSQVLLGYFGPVYLLQVSKNDDEERCF